MVTTSSTPSAWAGSVTPPGPPTGRSASSPTCRVPRSGSATSSTAKPSSSPAHRFVITTDDVPGTAERASTTLHTLTDDVSPGDQILINDGAIELRAVEVTGTDVVTEVIVGGRVSDHKGINLPGVAGERAGAEREGRARPALGLAPRRRHGGAVVRPQRQRHRGGARGHGLGGPPRPGDRQAGEAAGHRQPVRDRRRVRRVHGRPR